MSKHKQDKMLWQSIETAPKDGTFILVYVSEIAYDNGIHLVSWTELCLQEYKKFGYGWCIPHTMDEEGWFYEIANPSHWMPLPEKPD